MTAPIAAQAVGVDPHISFSVEATAHIVPGFVMLAGTLAAWRFLKGDATPGAIYAALGALVIVFSAALWILSAHLSLITGSKSLNDMVLALGHGGPGPVGAAISAVTYTRVSSRLPNRRSIS
jgi:hypothetical protein